MSTTLSPLAVGVPLVAPSRRGRRPAVAGAILLMVWVWLFSGFWASVQDRTPRQAYPAPTAAQTWIQPSTPGARAFFRFSFGAVTMPSSATLWLEGDQDVTAYLNGYRVNVPVAAPDHNIDTPADRFKTVTTLDLTPEITSGNVLGVEAVNLAGRRPAFRARLVLRWSDRTEILGTQPSDWYSTSEVALTGQELPQSGAFTLPTVSTAGWSPATAARPRSGTDTVTTAPEAFVEPMNASALEGSSATGALTASTTITTPSGCTSGWMRVAASGPYTVGLDGQVIARGIGGSKSFGVPDRLGQTVPGPPNTLVTNVYDICSALAGGSHTLTVRVESPRLPVIYLDGSVSNGHTVATFGTSRLWVSAGTAAVAPSRFGAVTIAAGMGYPPEKQLASLTRDSWLRNAHHLFLTAIVGLIAAFVLGLSLLLGVTRRSAVLQLGAAGVLPSLGLLGVLSQLRHFVAVQAPFPSTPLMLRLAVAVAVGGGLVAIGTSARVSYRRRAPVAGTPDPSRADLVVGEIDSVGAVSSDSDLRREVPARLSGFVTWLVAHWYGVAVSLLGAAMGGLLSYKLAFEPLWQDELSSIAAEQGMRSHFIPMWPSGFQYWKSELYTALIAIVGGISHDSTAWLRAVSVAWFVATVILFGVKLAPLVLPRRRLAQLAITLAFALSPIEMGHARDVRMYQMAQFFVVLLAVLLLRAIISPRTRHIALATLTAIGMYLTHEETFGVLVVVPLSLLAFLGFRWLRNWRWLVFGGVAVAVIGVQLVLVKLTHPPSFGVDGSNGPLISWSPRPFYYTSQFLLTHSAYGASLTIVTVLAGVGVFNAVRRRDSVRIYLAAFLVVPLLVVSLFLPAKDPRYAFISLPFDFALAGCGSVDLLDWVRTALRGSALPRRAQRGFVGVFAALGLGAVILSLFGGLADFGPLAQTVASVNVSHRQLDYNVATTFVRQRIAPDDAVIAAASANLVGANLGRPPTYWLPYRQSSLLLYLIEKDGRAVDTQYGIPALLSTNDLVHATDAHPRTWLIIADANISSLLPAEQALLISRYQLVEDGEKVSVFLATS